MRVLVVDDDADILRLLEIKLGKEGHEVTSATNGTAALAALDEQAPQLLVIETELSGTAGLDVIKAAKTRAAAPLVLILSHKDGDEDIAAGLAAGADDYLTKPFSPRALNERIRVAAIRNA